MKKLIHPNSTTKVPRFIPSFFRTMLLALLCMGGGSALAQTVTIQKVTPSGCYYYSGASKTTFSVQVGWTGANNNDIITVRIDNNVATQRIINVEDMYDPGTGSAVAGPIGTPQVVAFEIDADGISHTITAVMSGAHSATATPMVANAPTPCVPMACIAGELGGTIFNDNNADGVKQAGETVGLPGITITAFDKNGATYTATSDVRGAYAFSSANGNLIPSNAYPIRLEFTNFPAYAFSNSGPSLSGNKSSVRFVSSPQCDINCGAVNPINYSQSNPVLVTNLYTNNNPLGGGNAGTTAGLIAHDYTNETNFNYTTLATTNLIGSVWAKAWNKFSKKMIIAASLKRHSGFGPLGIGGLYMVNYTNPGSPVFSNFIDLTTLGIDLGQGVIPSNVARGMGASKTSANTDAQSYAYIGKAGIGGMDFSDDGNILYFVNLFDRKVYSLDLTTYFSNGTMPTAANLNSLVIPDPGCSNGSFRPYALKIRDGKMYIGIICDGSTGTKSNLVGIVKAYDFNTTSWSDVFDFPLTYPKGYPDQADGTRTGWYVWSDNPSIVNPGNNTAVMHPVPMLSDIEFDMDGTMVIALMDRTCHQYGIANNDNWNGSSWSGSSIWLVAAGGDVLRAFYSDGAYVLENAAKAGPNVGYAPTNNQGPGFGEFYNDNIGGGQLYHSEIGTGGLALRPGSGEVIAGMVDPSFYKGDGVLWANGIRKMSNTTGQPTGGKSYYSDAGISLFGKANGMGDMELVSDNVAYLEVGNYVYFDRNEDGIQTPGEPGIPNVQVKLYNSSTGALVASTTTDANGNYYFSTLNGHNIIPNTQYMIVMGETQFALVDTSFTIGGEKYKITQTDIGQGLNPDLNDNDFSETTLSTSLGAIPANLPFVLFTTGSEGYVRHSFDLGLKSCVAYAGLDQTINCVINSVTLGTPSKPYYTYSWSPSTGLNDSTLAQPTANPILTTTYTLTVNGICTDEVTVFVSNDPPVADAGINQNLGCSVTSATIGTTALSGNSYSWSPATGLNATNIAQPTASPSSTTTYTVTVTGSNGCTATSTVLVDVNTSPPTADAGSSQNLDCTTTSATIGTSAIGGNTYSWSPATGLSSTTIAQPTANPITTTTYTVTVTGSNGCTATSTATINVIATPPTADAGSTQNLDCTTTSATIGTSAIGGNTYSWSPATGLSSTTIAQPTASPSSTTVYTVTVTGSNGCTATSTVTVNVNTTTPTADAGSTQNLDCTTTSATIGTSAIGGNTYSWSPATGLSSTTIAQPTASPTSTTVYTVTVTGSNGCTATSTVTVNVNTTTPTADAGSTQNLDCTTTSATIGTSAIGGNTYSWSPATGLSSTTIAQPTASPSSTTVYTVTVTGSNGCTATSTVTVNVNTTAPTADAGSTLNLNCTTTSGTIGTAAIVGNTYAWLPATGLSSTTDAQPTASPTSTTTYTVIVTGSNGCTATSTVTVNVNTTAPTADAGSTLNLNCTTTSGAIGTAAIVGNTYAWLPATGLSSTTDAQPTASPTSTTTYTVIVTGSNGCTATSTVTVNVNTTAPTADAGSTLNLNCTTTSGTIGTAAIVGNTYAWLPATGLSSTTDAQPTASPTSTTTYTVTVTGSNGCTATSTVTVNVNTTAPTADAGSTLNLNCTTTSGAIGTAAIVGNTYAWLPATGLSSTTDAQPTASPTSTTTYTVIVTGSNGCTATSTVTVNVNTTAPTADAGSTLNLNCTTPSGSIGSASVLGNNYAWSPSTDLSATNISNPTVTPSTNTVYTTTYTVTVTGANTCTTTSTVTVNVDKLLPTANAGPNQSINYGSSTVIGTPAIVGNTYAWLPTMALSSSTVAQPTANPTAPSTTYTVTVTNANGCTETSTMTITVLLPTPTLVSYPNNQYCFQDNTILKSTGVVGATFHWTLPVGSTGVIDNSIPGESTVSITNLDASSNGTYSVYQSMAGYPNSPTDNVTINGATKPTINFITTSCVSNNGEITVNANGSNLEYAVNGGAFQSSNVLTTSAGSTFIVGIKEAGSSCIKYYTGECVSCTAPGACATPPQDSIVADSKTCVNSPISITGYFSNASNATWTTSGTGTFSSNACNASPCMVTYTPSASDIANSNVVITLSTDDPDGAGPCAAAVCSKNIELFNGTVFPTITNNGPVCQNTTLSLIATGSDGSITWTGPSGYSGTGDSIAITNAPATMSGLYTATSNIAGCTSSSASQNAVVVPIPTLAVSAIGNPELCAGGGNGSITVSVSGGSGVYDICYTGNLGNCVTGTSANFPWVAPGSYNVTVVDQICPNNVFTYPVTVAPGTPVPVPTIASSYSTCGGESLTLSGTVTAPAVNILWVHGPTFLNAVGNPLVIQNASMSMSGNYYAKAIDINGCASPQVATVVTISEKPVITHVQVNCFGSTATVTISATSATGTLSYSLDGTNYQASNEFTTVGQGNYTVHVKNGTSNCEATLPIYILNCACPNSPVVTITAPSVSCGTTTIPVSASFTNVGNATWSTTGTGTFSTTNGVSPLSSVYTPSATDIATGHVNLVVTTDDPDGAGPCSPTSETFSILLKDTLLQPSIITNQASYCQDDTLQLTSNTTNPIIWTGVGGFYADSSIGVVTGLTPFLSGYYKVTSTGNGCATKSDSVFITVAPAPVITVTKSVVNENCEGHANGEVTITATGGSGSYTICNSLFLNCATTSSSNTFKWLAPSTYTFYVADASCKSHQTSITATVEPGLHVDPPTGASYNSPVCVGEDLILTVTGIPGSTYLWTDLKNNYTATGEVVTRTDAQTGMSGDYKVQRLESGCASIDYILPVHIYDNPIITSADTMCLGSVDSGRITVNATIAFGDAIEYALNDGAYQLSNVFDNLTNGLFEIKARAVGSDCETTMNAIELYCACYCGRDAQVNVFPNPNDGTFNLNVNLIPKDASIVVSVFDMSGRTVYEQVLEGSNSQVTTSIDIKAFASGPYMVRVLIDNERFLVPITVNSK
jgi:hypothetical protein